MALLLDLLTTFLLAAGCFFLMTGALGILRMPDFYTRVHPAGKNDTLGVFLIMSALLVETVKYGYGWVVAGKLLLVIVFLFITAPAATHAITQAAFLDGLTPWRKSEEDSDAS